MARLPRRDPSAPDYCPPHNPPRREHLDATEHLPPVSTGRWYFATIEEREAWLRWRYDLAKAAGASAGVLYILRRHRP